MKELLKRYWLVEALVLATIIAFLFIHYHVAL